MATAGTMATAAGAAVLLYYVLTRRQAAAPEEAEEGGGGGGGSLARSRSRRRRLVRPEQPPATWLEAITTLSETLRFTYSETLGKWPIADLAFGINYLIRRQGNLHVASVYASSNCVQLKGPEIISELHNFIRLVTLCFNFSKKPFPLFLELAGYSPDDVLIQKPKAGILKPAFTIIHDKNLKCFLLLVRGTHSIKDTLTAATGTMVPFHHSVMDDGGISNLVLGYAHCGMVAAARWTAKLSTPILLEALHNHPDHTIEVVGHSLGGATAALLTYILREHKEFSSCSCIAFGPAACMTLELAESGKPFVTTIINGSDLVPTFSAANADGLRAEVTASSWINDLRDQVEHTRVLNVVYRSATALRSRLPSIATAKARVVGAGALLQPVSSGTQVVIKQARNVAQAVARTRPSLSTWSCIGPRRRAVGPTPNHGMKDQPEDSIVTESCVTFVTTEVQSEDQKKLECSSSSESGHDDTEEDEPLLSEDHSRVLASLPDPVEATTSSQFWYELEEVERKEELDPRLAEDREITEEVSVTVLTDAGKTKTSIESSAEISERQRFYPPGRIMHLVSESLPDDATMTGHSANDGGVVERVGIYDTPRELYKKIRLSRRMIHDHYMPVYRRMMESVIKTLKEDEDCTNVVLEDH